MTMNYARPTVADIDVALRNVEEVRALLSGLWSAVGGMQALLAKREESLKACRAELVLHAAEVAEREAQNRTATAATLAATANGRLLSVASSTNHWRSINAGETNLQSRPRYSL
jgi:hypothetical protein